MKKFLAVACALTGSALFGQSAPTGSAVFLPVPDGNPYACAADSAATIVTREPASSFKTKISDFVAMRLGPEGNVLDSMPLHDPIPSLAAQQKESFLKWRFSPPLKNGAPVGGWATVRLDLTIDYSKMQIDRANLIPATAQDPVPAVSASRWDDSWLDTAPPMKDSGGFATAGEMDTPPLPKKTKWYADRFKGPIAIRLWIETGVNGKVLRYVPADVRDAALIPYLSQLLSRWTIAPSRKAGVAVPCWQVLEISGSMSYDVDLAGAASLKKSAGPS